MGSVGQGGARNRDVVRFKVAESPSPMCTTLKQTLPALGAESHCFQEVYSLCPIKFKSNEYLKTGIVPNSTRLWGHK